ncbi:MAG TPA: regulatory iron-sulfur-containing complex subunit RicT, partial [Propionibacteriaceae bacterium]|nr:regulatory iron-sulfur-containing complex subunit RicT [Propionibacteriaceae bacterium]
MRRVLAVTFRPQGRLYYVDPGTTQATVGDAVLVPTDAGPEVATVAWLADVELGAELPVCTGRAEQSDLERETRNR